MGLVTFLTTIVCIVIQMECRIVDSNFYLLSLSRLNLSRQDVD